MCYPWKCLVLTWVALFCAIQKVGVTVLICCRLTEISIVAFLCLGCIPPFVLFKCFCSVAVTWLVCFWTTVSGSRLCDFVGLQVRWFSVRKYLPQATLRQEVSNL